MTPPPYPGPLDPKNYYAEAFFSEPGRCFRMVSSSTHGSPMHCPQPVEFQGQFQDSTGKWHDVWSCFDHSGDLSEWKRISASVSDIRDAPRPRCGRDRPGRGGSTG